MKINLLVIVHSVDVTNRILVGFCRSINRSIFEIKVLAHDSVGGKEKDLSDMGIEYVVANGDIDSPEQARHVLAVTRADAVMVGRAAQGRPWIFREMAHFLATGTHLAPPLVAEVKQLLIDHLHDHYALYGDFLGVRTARKHIGWYVKNLPGGDAFRARMNLMEDCGQQAAAVADFFDVLNARMDRLPVNVPPGVLKKNEKHMETTR